MTVRRLSTLVQYWSIAWPYEIKYRLHRCCRRILETKFVDDMLERLVTVLILFLAVILFSNMTKIRCIFCCIFCCVDDGCWRQNLLFDFPCSMDRNGPTVLDDFWPFFKKNQRVSVYWIFFEEAGHFEFVMHISQVFSFKQLDLKFKIIVRRVARCRNWITALLRYKSGVKSVQMWLFQIELLRV